MFHASLRPSSGAQGRIYCIWFSALDMLASLLGSPGAGRAHCVEDVIRLSSNILQAACTACFPAPQDTSQHIKC